MKTHAFVLGAILAVGAGSALAQDNSDRNYPYDARAVERQQRLEAHGLNYGSRAHLGEHPADPGAPYDAQGNGYPYAYGYAENAWQDRWGYRRDRWADRQGAECWNPRARHYEEVRPGERQDDLDFNRCRALRWR